MQFDFTEKERVYQHFLATLSLGLPPSGLASTFHFLKLERFLQMVRRSSSITPPLRWRIVRSKLILNISWIGLENDPLEQLRDRLFISLFKNCLHQVSG